MYLILAFFLSFSAFAKEIKVQYGLFKYDLTYDKSSIELKGKQLLLTLKKNECNAKLMDKFVDDVHNALKRMTKQKKEIPEAVKIETSQFTSFNEKGSKEGTYFLKLPDSFKTLKVQEKLHCRIKKS